MAMEIPANHTDLHPHYGTGVLGPPVARPALTEDSILREIIDVFHHRPGRVVHIRAPAQR
jgi:hypothetical protein